MIALRLVLDHPGTTSAVPTRTTCRITGLGERYPALPDLMGAMTGEGQPASSQQGWCTIHCSCWSTGAMLSSGYRQSALGAWWQQSTPCSIGSKHIAAEIQLTKHCDAPLGSLPLALILQWAILVLRPLIQGCRRWPGGLAAGCCEVGCQHF